MYYRNVTRPYRYNREDMHQAVLAAHNADYDGLRYLFFPVHVRYMKFEDMVLNLNRAGYHAYAYATNSNGVDFWVERMYRDDAYGDRYVNNDYRQEDLPIFEGDVK